MNAVYDAQYTYVDFSHFNRWANKKSNEKISKKDSSYNCEALPVYTFAIILLKTTWQTEKKKFFFSFDNFIIIMLGCMCSVTVAHVYNLRIYVDDSSVHCSSIFILGK